MLGSKTLACVIPARLKSTRFPKKMLSSFGGKPLLQWVYEAAQKVEVFDRIVFAVDSKEIAALIEGFGGSCYLTQEHCRSGTERLVELHQKKALAADIWVNWQGDEPFIQKAMIHDLLQSCEKTEGDVWTLKKRITQKSEIDSPHVAKVICDKQGFALYFSRSTIPYYRDPSKEDQKLYYKHIGIYAFSAIALDKIATFESCYFEQAEQLEQLGFLFNGLKIRVHETEFDVFGIDLPEHLEKAENFLKRGFF